MPSTRNNNFPLLHRGTHRKRIISDKGAVVNTILIKKLLHGRKLPIITVASIKLPVVIEQNGVMANLC